MSMSEYLAGVLIRDLRTARRELEAYPDEASLWTIPPGLGNSGGTLALHLAGNIQHFIGAVLGGTGYVRNREAEFSRREVTRTELIEQLEAAIDAVERVLPGMDAQALDAEFPIPLSKVRVATGDFLTHLAAHLAYHLGQLDAHRRVVTASNSTVGAQAIPELRSARAAV